jgi:uncharacterized membrane protein YeaQ/YmgE (transglycosylase-associated protein family)
MRNIIATIVIGLCAGWLAGIIYRGKRFSWIQNLVIGVIGAALGGLLFSLLGFMKSSLVAELVSATIGSLVLLWLIKRFGSDLVRD